MAPLVILATWATLASGIMAAAKTMDSGNGPAAFMWPPDRVWSADADNIAPCGSIAGVQNRTKFPLEDGQISLVTQLKSYDLELSISYEEDPRTNSDFEKLVDMETFRTMDLGHKCVQLPDSPRSVKPGSNATFQIKYISYEKPEKEIFYACTDVALVEPAVFKALNIPVPCFNATTDGFQGGTMGGKGGTATTTTTSSSSSSSAASENGSSHLFGGAVAGVVIGSIAGVAAVVAAGVLIFRRRRQRLRLLRQKNSERSKWAADVQSQSSTRMNNM